MGSRKQVLELLNSLTVSCGDARRQGADRGRHRGHVRRGLCALQGHWAAGERNGLLQRRGRRQWTSSLKWPGRLQGAGRLERSGTLEGRGPLRGAGPLLRPRCLLIASALLWPCRPLGPRARLSRAGAGRCPGGRLCRRELRLLGRRNGSPRNRWDRCRVDLGERRPGKGRTDSSTGLRRSRLSRIRLS